MTNGLPSTSVPPAYVTPGNAFLRIGVRILEYVFKRAVTYTKLTTAKCPNFQVGDPDGSNLPADDTVVKVRLIRIFPFLVLPLSPHPADSGMRRLWFRATDCAHNFAAHTRPENQV